MKIPKLYIDSDDVWRGYYVYAHACKATAKIFYVGRGQADRAWSANRSEAWHEFVASLPEGYEVRLLHEDLTEEESITLERQEIEAHGGAAAEGGSLINWIPGELGEGIGFGISIGLPDNRSDEEKRADELQDQAYKAVRKFKALSPNEKRQLADKFESMVSPKMKGLQKIVERCDRKDEDYPEGVDEAVTAAEGLRWIAGELASRRIKYLDFCFAADDELAFLETGLKYCDPKMHRRVQTLHKAVLEWFALFDTGNRAEAERAEHEEWVRQGGPEKLARAQAKRGE